MKAQEQPSIDDDCDGMIERERERERLVLVGWWLLFLRSFVVSLLAASSLHLGLSLSVVSRVYLLLLEQNISCW